MWRLRLSNEECLDLVEGVKIAVCNRSLPFDAETIRPQIGPFISQRKQEFQEAFKQKQIAAMNTLFAKLDADPHVVRLADGLRYEIVQPGNETFPHMRQTVLVNYTGRTLDGHIFDQTVNEPLHVDVGRVMKGWNEGIQKVGVGGKIRLYIPPSLGYGSDAVSGIPADSTLIYDIELLGITSGAK
jgi:FKBP-type peptidyl-prolyl cis-trans isomerase